MKSLSVSTKAITVIRNHALHSPFFNFFIVFHQYNFSKCYFLWFGISSVLFSFFFLPYQYYFFSKCFTGNRKGFARLVQCEYAASPSLFTLLQEARQKNVISICSAVQQGKRYIQQLPRTALFLYSNHISCSASSFKRCG